MRPLHAGTILITGAGGYLGRSLAHWWLENSAADLRLGLRADGAADFAARCDALQASLGAPAGRVSFDPIDVLAEHPFESVDPRSITAVVHCASVTRFNVDSDTARVVNVEGTEKAARFAERCPRLRSFVLISSVYASGLRAGPIAEARLADDCGFANHYEWSKWASEDVLAGRFSYLPWRIFRLATVIAENQEGVVGQQNAFHNTLRLFFYGLLSLIPGRTETPLYFVTGELARSAIGSLLESGPGREFYHVSPTAAEAVALGRMVDLAFESFATRDDFRRRRVRKPIYTDRESFRMMADAMRGFGGSILNQAVQSVEPFAPQLFVHKEIANDKLAAALSSFRPPDADALIRNTCDYLARTRWGRAA